MKRLPLAIAAIILLSVVPRISYARPPDFIFAVHGFVTENGVPVDGASVFAECGPDGVPTGTNLDGSYSASFATCFLGSTVTVRAYKGDSFGISSVLGTSTTTLNVEITNQHPDTTIAGTVSDHGHVVPGAKVIMKCGSLEKETVTDMHGGYSFVVPSADCPLGSNVHVLASEGNRSGAISADVNRVNNINIAIANIGIPEYTLLSGILAAGAGIGLIALRRHSNPEYI